MCIFCRKPFTAPQGLQSTASSASGWPPRGYDRTAAPRAWSGEFAMQAPLFAVKKCCESMLSRKKIQ